MRLPDLRRGQAVSFEHLQSQRLLRLHDTTAWDAYYPSLDRQIPDEIRPHARPANGSPFSENVDWGAVAADDRAMGDGQVAAWSRRQILAETGSPRFNAVGIYRPHLPWYLPRKYFDLYPLEEVELPTVLETDLDDISEIAKLQETRLPCRPWASTNGRGTLVSGRMACRPIWPASALPTRWLGRCSTRWNKAGARTTPSSSCGPITAGIWVKKARWRKHTLWRESTRVPLIVVAPGVTQPGTRSAAPVSLMDLYPTLTELAGLPTPDHVEGMSLVPLLEDPGASLGRGGVVTTYGYRNHAVFGRALPLHRLFGRLGGAVRPADRPRRVDNRADDPALAGVKAELAGWLPEHDETDAREPQ